MAEEQADVGTIAGQQQLKQRGIRPYPVPDDVSKPYWEAAAAHRLCCMHCSSCGRLRHPPSKVCPRCGSADAEWLQLSGEGTVYSFIVDHRNMVPGFNEPYVVATVVPVEADDDVRIVANIRDCSLDAVHIGMRVRVAFEDVRPGLTLPQFVPLDGG